LEFYYPPLSSPAKAGRSSIPEAAAMESKRRGVLDTRLRGYDDFFDAIHSASFRVRERDSLPHGEEALLRRLEP
jgi:hypothetical protein